MARSFKTAYVAGHRDRASSAAARERFRQERESGDVIEVRVGDQGVLDLELLGDRESAADATGVDQDAVVDEKRGGSLAQPFASEGAEHSNLNIQFRLALLSAWSLT